MFPLAAEQLRTGSRQRDVRFGSLADLSACPKNGLLCGVERTSSLRTSATHPKAVGRSLILAERGLEMRPRGDALVTSKKQGASRFRLTPCPNWLPFVDTYRTICRAPEPEFKRVLEHVRDMRADERLAAGDMDGEAVWLRIGNAIEELQSKERPEGEKVH